MKISFSSDRLAPVLFFVSTILLAFGYGAAVVKYEIFPYTIMRNAFEAAKSLSDKIEGELPWYYSKIRYTESSNIYQRGLTYDGLNLVVSIAADNQLSVRVTDMEGKNIHQWEIDWFDIWPNPEHIPESHLPKSRPGTHIHGAALLENGDLVFNFEHLGLVRLNICGDVVWRLPYRTHHSIYVDEDGNLWVSGQKNHFKPLSEFPNYKPSFIEYTILKVSPEGEIIQEISVMDLLKNNDLNGLLYMGTLNNMSTEVRGDTLHLNDVEVFPSSMEPGIFEVGDIMISLRNINTILVFRPDNKKIKFLSTGGFVRQHDPDFLDGNTISVFDNNNIGPNSNGHQSRILILSAIENKSFVYYSGNKDHRFYTNIMGKHQWLPNGNLLISEPRNGRAFEINKDGKIVWQFFNEVEPGIVGLMEEVERLPFKYTGLFSKERTKNCN
jgi:hypothetical protein